MRNPTPPASEDSILTRAIKECIIDYLNRHFSGGCMDFYKVATFLDPRYKSRFCPGVEAQVKIEAGQLFNPGNAIHFKTFATD